jgi:hypothetical protein
LQKVPEARRSDVEKLILNALEAAQKEFTAEQAVPPKPGKAISSVRRALLLYSPLRSTIWLPYLLFHTLLLFMLYLIGLRIIEMASGEQAWSMGDAVALLVAGLCAVLIRLTVGPALPPND